MKNDVIKLAIKIFLSIFLFSCLIFLYIDNISYKSEISKIRSNEITDLGNHNSFVVKLMTSITSDVLFLSRLPDLRNYTDSDHVDESLLEFSKAKRIYDQIRFLDKSGQEQSRINWNSENPIIIEKNNLQNKKGRYYFDDTINLKRYQVFISPMDLNIEYGEIENPIKPMLRIGTPLFDFENNKKGIVLLNYFAKDLIDNLRNEISSKNSSLYFLNQNGYWLYSNNSKEEWGFMYPDKTDIRFQNKFSDELWEEIYVNNSGQIQNEMGIFTYNTVYPLNAKHVSTDNIVESDIKNVDWKNYKWKFVSYIPSERLKAISWEVKKDNSIIAISFLIFALFISYILSRTIILKRKSDSERLTAEKRYHVLFEKAGESIVVTASDKTLMTNERSVHLFEYSQDEFLSMPVEALFHSDDRESITKMQDELFNNGDGQLVYEARAITKSGKEKWVEIRPTILEFNNTKALLYFFLDISARKIMEKKLERLATIDSLTQCFNRRFFTETLTKEIERSTRLSQNLSLIMMDIDFFKKVNDTYGHGVGDIVLQKFVELTNIEIRHIDTVGRLGGEEFALLLPNCSIKNGLLCAERIRNSIEEHGFSITGMEEQIRFTISLGVTQIKEDDSVESALKRVDNALYKAKNEGRNRSISL